MAKVLDLSIWMMLHAVDQRHRCCPVLMTVTPLTAPTPRMLELDAIHVSHCAHTAHSPLHLPQLTPTYRQCMIARLQMHDYSE